MRIPSAPPAGCMSDLGPDWREVARRVSHGAEDAWAWHGAFGYHEERSQIERGVFPLPGGERTISTVQGRDAAGVLCLYARMVPMVKAKKGRRWA